VRRLRLGGQSAGLPAKATVVALTPENQLVEKILDLARRAGMLQVVTPCVTEM
jgi:hypothetical protein